MSFEFSQLQGQALERTYHWFDNDSVDQQVFKIFGYAGSGKTTLATEIANNLGRGVMAATFTGKAALVMKKKGFPSTSTIHSLIYKVEDQEVDVIDKKTGKPTGEKRKEPVFTLNNESPLFDAKLLIVDEMSMVGEELAKDLLSFEVPILVLGDPGQLPPIKGAGYFIAGTPDVMLTEIHRQALENPIIRMSMDIRTGKGVKPGKYNDSRVIRKAQLNLSVDLNAADQVLCGRNATRRQFNLQMRALKGFNLPFQPMEGEKLICLRNNREKGLLNGGMWKVLAPPKLDGEFAELKLESLDIPGQKCDARVPMEFFKGDEDKIPYAKRRKGDEFDFGDCITVHKSQGSQWSNVLIFNENYCFREDGLKWLYTAVTRAADRLTLAI